VVGAVETGRSATVYQALPPPTTKTDWFCGIWSGGWPTWRTIFSKGGLQGGSLSGSDRSGAARVRSRVWPDWAGDVFDPAFGKLDVRMPDDVRRVTRCAVSRPELPEPAGMTAVVARANTSGPDADSGGAATAGSETGQRRSAHCPFDRWGGRRSAPGPGSR